MDNATPIDEYFSGSKTAFVIPIYQRKYAWQQKHCSRLFEDLKKLQLQLKADPETSHFFGSIVTVRASLASNDLLVIDGQQRITTLSILILAARNAVRNGDMEQGDDDMDEICKNYLYAPLRKASSIKLQPIEEDRNAYEALFKNNEHELVENSCVTNNYRLFYSLVKVSKLTFTSLLEAIDRLIVIDIRLTEHDNPQLIFESLNSCGKDLEEADKVRNYLLMSLSKTHQDRYYRDYWHKIELAADDLTFFIRDYLTIKRGILSKLEDLYFDFKAYDEAVQPEREALLADMLHFACLYHDLLHGTTGRERIDRKLRQIASIGTTVHMPFLLSFYDYATAHDYDEQAIYDVLDILENYWARRIICNRPSSGLQKMFVQLHGSVLRIIKEHERRHFPLIVQYASLLSYVMLRMEGTTAFPRDKEVQECFPTRDIYHISPKTYIQFLFERLENRNGVELNDTIIPMMRQGRYTIEHIMPQTLTPAWRTALGSDWQNIHETYLHTFANLTLTGYNSSYGNHTFKEKKEGYIYKEKHLSGFNNSPFTLSDYLKQHDEWTLCELKERGEQLLQRFLFLWPMPTTDYTPLERDREVVSFDDDTYELTGRTIIGYRYRGEFHPVKTWKEMLVQVCTLMYQDNATAMMYIASKGQWLHHEEGLERSKVAEQCYVWSSNSTSTKRAILASLFAQCNISPAVLELCLTPKSDHTVDDDEE